MEDGGERLRRRTALVLGAVGTAAGLVTLLGLAGASQAVPLGALVSGVAAAGGGAVVVRRGLGEGRPAVFRVLLGGAGVVWGAGQVLLGLAVAAGATGFPTVGDLISSLAAPLALAGLARLPQRSRQRWQGLRLALEALMVGAAAAALLWRTWFRQVLLPDLTGADLVGVAFLVADLSVVALVLICAVRELDRGLAVALVGVALYVAGDLATLHAVVQPGGGWPWQGAALACVGWPLVCAGMLQISAAPPDLPAAAVPRAESRRLVTVTAVVLVLLAGYLATLVDQTRVDGVSVALPAVAVVAFAGRELVAARQAGALMENLLTQARRDALTGLPNRWELGDRLRGLACGQRVACVLTLDLDSFKDVNGLLGHATGDLLLARVGQRLSAACRHGAEAFRLGGDEFAVLVPTDLAGATVLAEVLREEVSAAAADVPGVLRVPLSASVGVAVLEHDDASGGAAASAAMTRSALALRLAKTAGRDCVQAYSAELAAEGQRRAAVERGLRRAVADGTIEVHLQPVVELATGRLVGFESLARWTDPELGRVPPDEFVAVAEASGLVVELGDLVLRRAMEAAVTCGSVAAGVNIAVNVSAPQLRVPGFAARVAAALQGAGMPPRRLVLELTEGIFVSERDPAVRTLHELVELGVTVAIDDFGTGYSALGYLDRLPVQIVKIDRSLTARFDDPRTVAVARAVVDLGRGLGLDVVVEGIERPDQAGVARRLGAQYGQGWLWSPAVPVAEAPALMTRLAGETSRQA